MKAKGGSGGGGGRDYILAGDCFGPGERPWQPRPRLFTQFIFCFLVDLNNSH